ncbi:MAG: hypothetical protein P8Y70_21030 [Candidatus Lokiarchaeota archaeon]
MNGNDSYVSGLKIENNSDGGFDLMYNRKRFPEPIKFEDLQYISNPKSKAGIKKTFDSFFSILDQGINIDDARKEVVRQARELLPEISELKDNEKEVLPDIQSWEEFKAELESHIIGRTEDFLVILSVIVSYWHADRECIYMLLLAPRGKFRKATP